MKLIATLFAAIFVAGCGMTAEAQVPDINRSAPGIFINGRASVDDVDLPAKAKDFIHKNFKFQRITECEQETPSGNYEVELGDGTELVFDHKGNWLEVDARDDQTLPARLVERLLPKKAYRELVNDGYSDSIESVWMDSDDHYNVEVDEVLFDGIIFDGNGTITSFQQN